MEKFWSAGKIAIAILVAVSFVFSILWIAIGIVNSSAVIEAMFDDSEEDQPSTDNPDSPGEDPPISFDSTKYYNRLHELICTTDLEQVRKDLNSSAYQEIVHHIAILKSWKGWDLVNLLYAYALACEICMRDEINPTDAIAKITPEQLLGELFGEGGGDLSRFEQTDNGYCWWLKKDATYTGNGIDLSTLAPLSGPKEYKYTDYGLYNCNSPYGQMLFYSYNWNADPCTSATSSACIYISWLENPSLDNDHRAIVGTRQQIYEGEAKYATTGFWNGEYEAASYDRIKEDIKATLEDNWAFLDYVRPYGYFIKGLPMGYQTRPASYFLPDSMYTHALWLRYYLSEIGTTDNMGGLLNSSPRYTTLEGEFHELLSGMSYDKTTFSDACAAIAMNRFSYPNNRTYNCISFSNIVGGSSVNEEELGIVPRVLADLVANNISFNLAESGYELKDYSSFAGIPHSVTGRAVFGIKDGDAHFKSTLNMQKANFANMSIFNNSALVTKLQQNGSRFGASIFSPEYTYNAAVMNLDKVFKDNTEIKGYEAYQKYMIVPGPPSSVAEPPKRLLWELFAAEYNAGYPTDETAIFYGTDNVIAGHFWGTMVEETAEVCHDYHPIQSTTDPKAVTGRTCLGDGCLCEFAPEVRYVDYPPAAENTYSDITTLKYSTALEILSNVSSTASLKLGSSTTYTTTSNEVRYDGNEDMIYGISPPFREKMWHSTNYQGHQGVDLTVLGGNTEGAEVHPIADGVVVMLATYPYDIANIGVATKLPDKPFIGYGNNIAIMHKSKEGYTYFTHYGHLTNFAHIKLGSIVTTDTIIGYAGSTGKSTGAHLHLEVRYAETLNPEDTYYPYTRPQRFMRNRELTKSLFGED